MYKAISEGLINLADRFFEMEYLDAHKGLEVYKESIVANDRLQQYYQQIEQIEELRRAIQFPKLESPPADFLTQMEAYAKEAPRPYDESSGAVTGSKKVPLSVTLCRHDLFCRNPEHLLSNPVTDTLRALLSVWHSPGVSSVWDVSHWAWAIKCMVCLDDSLCGCTSLSTLTLHVCRHSECLAKTM